MAPTTSPTTKNRSKYLFSVTRVADGPLPSVIECVVPSPPRCARGTQLSATRIFKTSGVSLKKLKEQQTKGSLHTSTSSIRNRAPSSNAISRVPSQRASTPSSSRLQLDSESSDSPLDSISSSPPSVPIAIARARSPLGARRSSTSRIQQAAPYTAPLTRSASRSSLKSPSKSGNKKSSTSIALRLQERGGIVTRYGDHDGEPIFIRDERVTSTTEPDVVTHFWESFSLTALPQPPDLTAYPDLSYGDVYCNILKGDEPGVQLWIWTSGSDGKGHWKRAREGEAREDGRRLMVTPKRQQPSWVSPTWGVKQLRNQGR